MQSYIPVPLKGCDRSGNKLPTLKTCFYKSYVNKVKREDMPLLPDIILTSPSTQGTLDGISGNDSLLPREDLSRVTI